MIWAVWCKDADDAAAKRNAASSDHSKYLNAASLGVLMAGPLTSDDGAGRNGSLFLLQAEDRQEIERFVQSDPFFQNGVWSSITISAFHMSRNRTAEFSSAQ
jgi:uncharacterized protein